MSSVKARILAWSAALLGLAALAAGAFAQSLPSFDPMAGQPGPAPRVGITAPDPWPGMKKLLVVADVQTGYHHDSINHAIAVIERLGRESGAYATVIRTDSQLITKQPIPGTGRRYENRTINARNLDYFDAVYFLGSGAGTLTAAQKADLLSFVRDDGKGFIAGHAAIVANYEWPEFVDMIGGFMAYEYPVAPKAVLVDPASFPGASRYPRALVLNDQFPVLQPAFSSRGKEVIMRLDAAKLTPEERARRPDGDFPLVWRKAYGKGRVFSSTLAHDEHHWDDPRFQQLQLEAIKWAMGGWDNPAPAR